MIFAHAQSEDRIKPAVLAGWHCHQFTCYPEDKNYYGINMAMFVDNERLTEGKESYLDFDFMAPDGLVVDPDKPYLIAEVHSQNIVSQEMTVHIYGDELDIVIKRNQDDTDEIADNVRVPITLGQKHNLRAYFKMSTEKDGRWEFLLDGKRILWYRGPTLFKDEMGAYVMWGCYPAKHWTPAIPFRRIYMSRNPVWL